MKVYSVTFIDGRDGYYNHALLETASIDYIHEYMLSKGHTIVEIKEEV